MAASKGELEKIAPESLNADWSTPGGQRLAKRDLERLYRLLAVGVDAKYLAADLKGDFSDSATFQHEPEDRAQNFFFDSQHGVCAFEIDQLGDLGWDAVHAWNLQETSGNRADQIGGVTLTDINTVTSGAGLHGGSSTSALFTAPNSEQLRNSAGPSTLLPVLGSNWQIAMWFRTTALSGNRYLYSLHDGAGTQRAYIIFGGAGDNITAACQDSTGVSRVAPTAAGWLSTNANYPLRVWYDDMKRQIAIQIGFAPSIRTNNTTGWGHSPVLIGGPWVPSAFDMRIGGITLPGYYFDGRIDSISISNGPGAIWSDRMWERYCRGEEYPFRDQWQYGDAIRGAKTVLAAKVVLDMSTTGSDASNLYTVTVAKNAATTLFSKTTNGAEIVAGTVWDLGAPAVSALADGDYLAMKVTKTGAPTDLRLARGRLVVQYEAA